MTITIEQQNEARAKARGHVAHVRVHTPGLDKYSDRQLWQAILDAKSTHSSYVALVLLDHIMNGRIPPECPYELEDPS